MARIRSAVEWANWFQNHVRLRAAIVATPSELEILLRPNTLRPFKEFGDFGRGISTILVRGHAPLHHALLKR